jgi:hypothetical protein
MPKRDLENQLAELTQDFVVRLVEVIRNASFAEVAALSPPRVAPVEPNRPRRTVPKAAPTKSWKPVRQTAARRAELGDRVLKALEGAPEPLGVRALSSLLSVAPDLLALPLRELRASGRVKKHGEKRNTTYSAA